MPAKSPDSKAVLQPVLEGSAVAPFQRAIRTKSQHGLLQVSSGESDSESDCQSQLHLPSQTPSLPLANNHFAGYVVVFGRGGW